MMPRAVRCFVALLLGWSALSVTHAAEPTFPALSGRVVDAANAIPDDAEARLTHKLAALDAEQHRQLVVATIADLQGFEISDYGYQLGRAWGIGTKERDDGVLLIVAPKERKLRIEVGYGLEGVLTDGVSSLIINQSIVPRFKDNDIPGGIDAGIDAIIRQITLPVAQAQALTAMPAEDDTGFAIGLIVAFVFVFLFIFGLIWLIGRASVRGSRTYRGGVGAAPVAVWGSSDSSSDSWSSGSSESFSGGGGDFGGGGASGDW